MKATGTIAELPFRRREALDLLDLREHRDAPSDDYTGYGYAFVEEIRLEGRSGEKALVVRGALVVAVHSMEEPVEVAGDIELEFFVPEVAADYSVTVLLSAFLGVWLPLVRQAVGSEPSLVLVVCNPNRARLPRFPALGNRPVHYPLGDVESWLDVVDGRSSLRLVADSWKLVEQR